MRKRLYGVLFLSMVLMLSGMLAGCGSSATDNGETPEKVVETMENTESAEGESGEPVRKEIRSDKETSAEKQPAADGVEPEQGQDSLEANKESLAKQSEEVETQVLSGMQMVSLEVENASNFAMELPGFMDRNEASLEADPELEALLIRHYGLTEEISRQTRYYYDRIDLNEDSVDEIFVILVGPQTTGKAGSMGSLVLEENGELKVEKDFSQLYMPIVVSTNTQENWHDLILCVGENDGTEHYVVLTYRDGSYAIGGQMLETLEGIDGAAYLCNDLNEDQETGRYLTLGEEIEKQ